jgi:putative hydrolase of HD superfamily
LILNFFYTASNLKKIPRQGWIDKLSISHPESVADHTFSMAIIGMIFSDLEKYNTEKILKMILLHDLAESVTGDITPDKITNQKKMFLENNVMEKIIDDMPQSLQIQYQELWKDYQNEKSEEAKFVHQLDKFEMALQAKIYSKDGYSDDKLRSFFDSAKNNITHPKLVELFKKIIEE